MFGQLPKGDRVLAWQVDMAEDNDYNLAFTYAQDACMESIHLSFSWSGIEPTAGSFDPFYISNTLDIANIYFPAFNTKVELQLAPVNTVAKETPTDLLSTNFDDPNMISRFKTLLDTVFAHIPNLELSVLNIGNESDIYFGIDNSQYTAYKTFLNEVIPYAKQLYFNLHGTDLKVGTTLTFHGLTAPSTVDLCQNLNNGLDIVALTYYPLNGDFTVNSPSVVSEDFDNLVNVYSDSSQPIYLVECGYPSSETCNSSVTLQAQFYQNIFNAWDTHADNIKYLTVFKSTDWSTDEVADLGVYYGISDVRFLEYLRTLGVREWENSGTNKLAYETILCALSDRNWCATNCTLTSNDPYEESLSLNLYPNPTTGEIFFQTEKSVAQIKIYNNLGALSLKSTNRTVNLSDLPNGVYLAIVQFENGERSLRKIVKE